jgi:hypothetical protein
MMDDSSTGAAGAGAFFSFFSFLPALGVDGGEAAALSDGTAAGAILAF